MTTSLNKNFTIPDINIKNGLSEHFVTENIIKEVTEKVKTIPNYHLLKNEVELLKFICNIIENMILKNKKKIDKKDIVIKIFSLLFSLTEPDKENLSKLIDFLHQNKLIKRLSLKKQTKIFINNLSTFFLKTSIV